MQEEIDALVIQRDTAMDKLEYFQKETETLRNICRYLHSEKSKLEEDIFNLMKENKEYHDELENKVK